LDPTRYRSISPEDLRAPIVSFLVDRAPEFEPRLRAANLVISLGADRIRVSPAIYNTESDIDLLAEVLNT
jgi:selenocysteine lyase/cysteine desulfurase